MTDRLAERGLDANGHLDPRDCMAAEAEVDALAAVAKAAAPLAKCPLYGHTHLRKGGVTDYTEQRRIDCADDQCTNPDCVKWVDCTHPSHALAAALANIEGGAS